MPARPRHSSVASRALLAVGVSVSLLTPAHASDPDPRGIAFVIVDLQSGATLASAQPDITQRPVLPGSVMKVAAVAAALESGVIDEHTRIVCTRSIVVDGHRLTCTHPDLHRALTPSEALMHSCNVYVATITAKLPRAALDRSLAALGLPPSSPSASVQASALGLEGTRVPARTLMNAVARVANRTSPLPWKPGTLDVLREGLRGAAQHGTAAALGAAGIDALAKTGTVDVGGLSQGLVVGVTPASHPTRGFALLAAGGAGVDAAGLIATRLRALPATNGAPRPSAAPAALPTQGRSATPPTPAGAAVRRTDNRDVEIVRVGLAQPNGRYAVREMTLDEYVAGVVAGEAAAGSAPAALDALAIAVRTYTLANRNRHTAAGFDLCDLTHCQVFRRPNSGSEDAAMRTAGRYLSEHGQAAHIFYTASCGGFSERAPNVWRGAADPGFLPSKADPACANESAWRDQIDARDLLRALRVGGFNGDTLRSLAVSQRSASGRAAWLHLDGVTPDEISGDNLRTLVGRTLGWQHIRSTLFSVSRTSAGFEFSGSGAGHGVGLCVIGSAARARDGSSAEEILRNYFPGLTLATLGNHEPSTFPLRITLPQQDEQSRAPLTTIAASALRAVAAALDAPLTTPIALRFHPTVESYQRATGQPWFTSAATHGHVVDLLPVTVLRQRGLLESTLRHELAHAVTSDVLQRAPLWVQEGVAMWASRSGTAGTQTPQGVTTGTGVSCPSDADFTRASSAETLRKVYAAAEQCYVRDLAKGRSWRTWPRAAD
jgi:stage II sporulation protein D